MKTSILPPFRSPRARAMTRGNATVELAVLLPVAILLLFGVVSGGLILDRYMTIQQLARNGAAMFARGADFAVSANQQLLLESARGLRIEPGSGSGVIIFTRLEMAPAGTTNAGLLVIAERHIVGDPSYRTTRFGVPSSTIWPHPDRPMPNGRVKGYQEEPSAIARNVPSDLSTLPASESMYIVEVYYDSSDLSFGGVWAGAAQPMSAVIYF